jgi:hypothetical protein
LFVKCVACGKNAPTSKTKKNQGVGGLGGIPKDFFSFAFPLSYTPINNLKGWMEVILRIQHLSP